jgi:hypothetical protein
MFFIAGTAAWRPSSSPFVPDFLAASILDAAGAGLSVPPTTFIIFEFAL